MGQHDTRNKVYGDVEKVRNNRIRVYRELNQMWKYPIKNSAE